MRAVEGVMVCMGARRNSSPGPLLILFTTHLRTHTVACMAVHVMHTPCIHLNSSVHTDHMRTDPHRYDHIHYRIASHARRLSHLGAYDKRAAGSAARGAAARLQPLPTRSSGHATLPRPSQTSAAPASPQPLQSRLVAAAGGPCACIPSREAWDVSLRCSTCRESTERSHGTQRCEGEKGMRRHEEVQERTGRGLWARPGAKLTAASRRSCWTNLSKRNLRYEIRWGA